MPSPSTDPASFTYPLPTPTQEQVSSNALKTILISGINGYIASHVALLLLKRGYTVLGTSRSPDTLPALLSQPAFRPYASTNTLKHIVVPDITAPHAFDAAVRGVRGIIHTASPVDFTLTSTDAFFAPAIGGVQSILQSAYDENRSSNGHIQSFIQLSSIAAVADRWRHPSVAEGGPSNHTYTEADWNTSGEAVARASEKAGKFLPVVAYGASKAAAELSMWEFASAHADAGFVCSSINPGVVTGPPVNWPATSEKLNETLLPVWNIYSGVCKQRGALPPQIGGAAYVDVRDVAALHVWALENPGAAGGERYLATNGKAPPQAVADLLRDVLFKDDEGVRERVFAGEPGKGYVSGYGWPGDEPTLKATKAYSALGVAGFRGFEESVRDTVEAFMERWG